jgi:dTDP-4-amino-4,6-dideoxygalactose transaminase
MENRDALAIHGGPKAKTVPFGKGKRFGEEEKRMVCEVIDSDMLFYVFGTKVKQMEANLGEMYKMKHTHGCSSGTAAVHIALGSLEIPPGKEVITSSITDMGTITGILYQLLIPRFADINPRTYNMDPQSTEQLISNKTGAIIVVHHAGLPAEMDAFLALGKKYNIPIIEDCAQAWWTTYHGKLVGTMGDVAAFSLNHFKHITTGSGGAVMTNRDDVAANIKLFIDKCYFRDGRKRNPYFLAPNYQMTELQGAVAIAQLKKVQQIVETRYRLGMQLLKGLAQIPGIIPQHVSDNVTYSFFLTVVRLDPTILKCSVDEFCTALTAEGIPNEPHKITGGMPTYLYDVFQTHHAFPKSELPFVSLDLKSNVSYPKGMCPHAELAFEQTFNLSITEFYSDQDIEEMIYAVKKVAQFYS